jgi:hypothetical protein
MPDVTPEDLDRLTVDLQAAGQGLSAIDRSKLAPQEAHALDDVQTVLSGATKASDLMARLKRANGSPSTSPSPPPAPSSPPK